MLESLKNLWVAVHPSNTSCEFLRCHLKVKKTKSYNVLIPGLTYIKVLLWRNQKVNVCINKRGNRENICLYVSVYVFSVFFLSCVCKFVSVCL